MTDIDVPDWVVEAANDVLADHARDGDGVAHEALKAALRAALSAWVETGAYQSRLIAKRAGKLVSDWREVDKELFDAVGGKPHEGAAFRVEYRTLFALRQEKPE